MIDSIAATEQRAYTANILNGDTAMNVQISWFGVLLAGVSSMLIGFIYYLPSLFGKRWMKLASINEKMFKKEQPKLIPLLFVAAVLTAYVMAHFVFIVHHFFGDSWMAAGIVTSLWAWLGFSFTTLFVHNSMDQRPFNLVLISWGNRLLTFLAMGLILGWLHP